MTTTTMTTLATIPKKDRSLLTLALDGSFTFRGSDSVENMQEDQQRLNAMSPLERPSPLTGICPRPIPNSYWATPLLLACEYPWSPYDKKSKLDNLLLAGVRTFIDLTEAGELSPYAELLSSRAAALGIDTSSPPMLMAPTTPISPPTATGPTFAKGKWRQDNSLEYHRFPIRDRSLPQSLSLIHSIISVLQSNASRGRISAVHCRGGIGRTGLVVGCWLVASETATDGDDALRIIAKEWKGVEKRNRFPCSPETGPQWEFVRNWKRGNGFKGKGICGVGSGLTMTGGVRVCAA